MKNDFNVDRPRSDGLIMEAPYNAVMESMRSNGRSRALPWCDHIPNAQAPVP
ncbi:hypothetical protein GCM10007901_26460 [Dyella acidisoli]|uniref:Uncharacterized protein n=1 Tax=Dyella acidisoli TaxID=1867834 RepID=A0ABQ5XPP0_9GAMM|nr:hypothetical protein GCM10007901_26460 [Dyella acidisoli]